MVHQTFAQQVIGTSLYFLTAFSIVNETWHTWSSAEPVKGFQKMPVI